MCTITYIPQNDQSFIITQSRDELASRSIAAPPILRKINNADHYYPVDPDSKGTWIGMSENQKVACLINGGVTPYNPKPPYRHSRGLIIPNYFEHSDFNVFYHNFQFENLEPFTLFTFENNKLLVLRKEQDMMILKELDKSVPHIFSSINLYTTDKHELREKYFHHWLKSNSTIQIKDTIRLHDRFRIDRNGPVFLPNGKDKLQTLSTTAIHYQPTQVAMTYYDRPNNMSFVKKIKFRKLVVAA